MDSTGQARSEVLVGKLAVFNIPAEDVKEFMESIRRPKCSQEKVFLSKSRIRTRLVEWYAEIS